MLAPFHYRCLRASAKTNVAPSVRLSHRTFVYVCSPEYAEDVCKAVLDSYLRADTLSGCTTTHTTHSGARAGGRGVKQANQQPTTATQHLPAELLLQCPVKEYQGRALPRAGPLAAAKGALLRVLAKALSPPWHAGSIQPQTHAVVKDFVLVSMCYVLTQACAAHLRHASMRTVCKSHYCLVLMPC